ncbi:MAG: putative toxin-antitoxin system toxin component, PIN family [Caldilineaceae bacterium]
MKLPQILLDTNVLIAAQRSRRGASSKLISFIGTGRFDVHISVALVLEYEAVLMRYRAEAGWTQEDVTDFVDSICALAQPHEIHYQWRPYLHDPDDEFVLDLAVAAGCTYLVTFNQRHFAGIERFNIQVVTPGEFLAIIGVTS